MRARAEHSGPVTTAEYLYFHSVGAYNRDRRLGGWYCRKGDWHGETRS